MIFEEKFFPIETYNVGIDSAFRDRAKYPSASEYIIPFDNIFKNVVSVQLVFAVYEKNGVESYVNLHIEELSPNLVANTQAISGSFCQLPLMNTQNVYDTSMYKCIKTFEKPLAKLSRLTIRFIKANGEVYPMRDHFLKMEVRCLKFSGRTKEWSNNEMFTQSVSVYEPSMPKKKNGAAASVLIKVPAVYDMDVLKMAFRSASETLRASGLSQSAYKARYNELREEFKRLCEPLLSGGG